MCAIATGSAQLYHDFREYPSSLFVTLLWFPSSLSQFFWWRGCLKFNAGNEQPCHVCPVGVAHAAGSGGDGIEESQGDDWKGWLSLFSRLQGSIHLRRSVNHCHGECGHPGQGFVAKGGNLQVFPAQCHHGPWVPIGSICKGDQGVALDWFKGRLSKVLWPLLIWRAGPFLSLSAFK